MTTMNQRHRRLAVSVMAVAIAGAAVTLLPAKAATRHLAIVPPTDHIAIRVEDLDRAIAWYVDNLDFKVVMRFVPPDAQDLRFAFIQRNATRIELIGGGAPNRATPPPASEQAFAAEQRSTSGFNHIGFLVEDVDRTVAIMRGRGARVVVPPTTIDEIATRLAHVQDSEGNDVELVEPIRKEAGR